MGQLVELGSEINLGADYLADLCGGLARLSVAPMEGAEGCLFFDFRLCGGGLHHAGRDLPLARNAQLFLRINGSPGGPFFYGEGPDGPGPGRDR